MNPEPEPCSTCGRRRNWGKKSSKPGGRRWLSARSTCCDLMNTTAGFTWSAMDTKASPKSATAFGTTTGVRGALPWAPSSDGVGAGAAATDSGRPPALGRPSVEANARPKMKAIATSAPNLSQSRVRTDIVVSSVKRVLLLVVVHDFVVGVDHVLFLFTGRL